MRIAVPTNDGVSMSEHFGRSAGFLIFGVEDGRIATREMRSNQGQECHTGDHGAEHACGAQGHGGIAAMLSDCQFVLCAGMGQRAADALRANGISAILVQPAGSAEETVASYLAGKLRPATGGCCSCHH